MEFLARNACGVKSFPQEICQKEKFDNKLVWMYNSFIKLIKELKMQQVETEYKSAGHFAWFAAKDARQKSLANKTRFSNIQLAKADRVSLALELVYYCEKVTIDYCKKWIRVKVHKAQIKDKKSLALLETDWGNQGIVKVITDQGIIYRVV